MVVSRLDVNPVDDARQFSKQNNQLHNVGITGMLLFLLFALGDLTIGCGAVVEQSLMITLLAESSYHLGCSPAVLIRRALVLRVYIRAP